MDIRRGAKEGVPIMAEAEHRLPPCENNGKSTENDGNNASCCSDSCCSDEGVVERALRSYLQWHDLRVRSMYDDLHA